MTADEHHIGMSLCYSRRDRADSDLGNQFYRNPRFRIGIAQIINQLRQILDRINVVMRRRRDQADIRHRMTDTRNKRIHLMSGKLAALTRFRPLSHLDLKVFGMTEIINRHAEPSAGDLFDRTGTVLAIRAGRVTRGILSALTAVAHTAKTVHRNRDRLMRFRAQRSERHGTRHKAFQDGIHAFHLLQRNRFCRSELKQTAQSAEVFRLIVDQPGIAVERLPVVGAYRLTECRKRLRRPQMLFPVLAETVLSAVRQQIFPVPKRRNRGGCKAAVRLGGNPVKPDPADTACRAGEIGVNHLPVQPDRFKNLTGAITPQSRNAHFGHYFQQPFIDRMNVIARRRDRVRRNRAGTRKRGHALKRKIRIDRRRTEADQKRKVHDLADFTGLHNQSGFGSQSGSNQRPVHRGDSQQGGNRHAVLRQIAVGKHQDPAVLPHGLDCRMSKIFQRKRQNRAIAAGGKFHRQNTGLKILLSGAFQPEQFIIGQHRTVQLDQPCVSRSFR